MVVCVVVAACSVEAERLRLYDKEHLQALILGGEFVRAVHYARQFVSELARNQKDFFFFFCRH